MRTHSIPLGGVAAFLLVIASSLPAQGRLILDDRRPPAPHTVVHPPRPHPLPVELRSSRITSRIEDRLAVTQIQQVFFNPNPRPLEGQYVFPLPPGATIGKFSLTAGGQEMTGEVHPRQKARALYEDIVRRQQDPALLEYLDWGLFKARVFPIPPRADVTLTFTFDSVLEADGNMVLLQYPFTHPGSVADTGGKLAIQAEIKTSRPLKSVYSPSHPVDVVRRGSDEATVSYEGDCRAGKDFLLYLTTDARPFGLHVLTHKKPGEPGFFLAMLSPKVDFTAEEIEPKDVILVLDTSGSMKGEKMQQAKDAARFCLQSLNARDRFNVICFSTDARPFRETLVDATPAQVKAALAFVDQQEATGGTNIHEALRRATGSLDAEERVGITLFMTDGIPTIDVIDKDQILAAVRQANRERNRIFVFGVGSDVNTKLLDLLAEQNRGTRTYVGPAESIEVKVSAFYEKVRYPVLSDLQLEAVGFSLSDTYPRRLPDLFKGSQLLVFGRYSDTGAFALRLNGRMKNRTETYTFEAKFPAENVKNDFIPRLWAMRKVGFLLDQVRLHGTREELTDAIVALGKRYGIVTPHTSFLVIEDERQMRTRLGRPGAPGELLDRKVDDAVTDLRLREKAAGEQASGAVAAESGDQATAVSRASKELRAATSTPAAAPPDPQSGGGAGSRGAVAKGTAADGFGGLYFGRRTNRESDLGPELEARLREAGYGFRVMGGKTFVYLSGLWIDTDYDAETMRKSLTKVEAFSDAYFQLLADHEDAAKMLAIGANCIVVLKGKAYQVFSPASGKKEK